MYGKRNYTVRKVLRLAFFTQHNPKPLHQPSVPFYCCIPPERGGTSLTIHPLKDIWVVSSFWLLHIKLL